ncbi:glutamate 5-kinase [Geoalkalibacter ferrihydriticus]|uniref:Glutamate 5-kinase n=2 Tax=Geoalkalibacter ferrihydriticus TaxID=392333 RepID=A0A0C2HM67_9BACT|nr:glutamate 5-kinase [Geoalkalibacter ferrihydriticus]KIH76070.1 gamma-glutamyl kinase [Geoalkalibacter ferrihydriticus DSM 17813]SDM46943.1 glutamate 5-kinase [Geoalkalibacter ferrihydriticus]
MRQNFLKRVRRAVIKIGSNVISDDTGLLLPRIAVICDEVCRLRAQGLEVILVSSGAVSAGKGVLGISGRPQTIPLKQAAAAIGQPRLMRAYKEGFQAHGYLAAQILLTRDDLANRRRYLNARNTLVTLLDFGVTPIINENDTVVVEEIRFGDNDNLSAMVTSLLEVDLLVILSDVDGLYDRNPQEHPEARLIPLVERVTDQIQAMAGGEGSVLGTGGMASKVKAARRASLNGIGTLIINGRTPQTLGRAFAGEEIGTYFLPARDRMAAKKHWIAFTKKPRGKVFVDDGARRALLENGKSLLPSGITGVEGRFERGDSVRLCDPAGNEFAKGVIGYNLTELLRIMGKKTSEIEASLGYKYGDEVIHRDNLVISSASETDED